MNTEQAVLQQYQQMKQEQNMLARKLADMDATLKEHRVVIDVLEKVEPTRTCYRLVNGVLVERTASEVIPALQTSCEKIEGAMKEINDEIATKTKEINEFADKYKIGVREKPAVQE